MASSEELGRCEPPLEIQFRNEGFIVHAFGSTALGADLKPEEFMPHADGYYVDYETQNVMFYEKAEDNPSDNESYVFVRLAIIQKAKRTNKTIEVPGYKELGVRPVTSVTARANGDIIYQSHIPQLHLDAQAKNDAKILVDGAIIAANNAVYRYLNGGNASSLPEAA